MLEWLDQFFTVTKILVGQQVSDVTHWAMHALASVVFGVFKTVGAAWSKFTAAVTRFGKEAGHFAHEVWAWATYLVRVVIPRILRWAEAQLAKLAARLAQVYHELITWVTRILALIRTEIDNLTKWIVAHIYTPLKNYADQIARDLRKWGYTAWWYITHPAALAELLINDIVTSFERHAWDIAPKLGSFLLSLIVRNLPKLVHLVEDIITAVF